MNSNEPKSSSQKALLFKDKGHSCKKADGNLRGRD